MPNLPSGRINERELSACDDRARFAGPTGRSHVRINHVRLSAKFKFVVWRSGPLGPVWRPRLIGAQKTASAFNGGLGNVCGFKD